MDNNQTEDDNEEDSEEDDEEDGDDGGEEEEDGDNEKELAVTQPKEGRTTNGCKNILKYDATMQGYACLLHLLLLLLY